MHNSKREIISIMGIVIVMFFYIFHFFSSIPKKYICLLYMISIQDVLISNLRRANYVVIIHC